MYLGPTSQVIVVLRLLPVMPKVFRYPKILSEGSLVDRLYPEYSGIDLRSASADNGWVVAPDVGPLAVGCYCSRIMLFIHSECY